MSIWDSADHPSPTLARGIRVGVFGAGRMGTRHARVIASTGAVVSAVCDRSREAAERLAGIVGATLATTSPEEFFEQKLDGVVIATPPSVRVPAILDACEHRIHLFIEKPSVLTLSDGRRCMEQIEKAGILAGVGYKFRYAPVFERMKYMLSEHEIHAIRSLGSESYYVTYYMPMWKLDKQQSGGAIAEQSSHLLDLARYLLGNTKPVRAMAVGAKRMALERTDCDVENSHQILYELEPQTFGTHTSHCGTVGYSVEMELIGAHLRVRNFGGQEIVGYRGEKAFREESPRTNALGVGVVGAWLRAIETGDPSLIRAPFSESLHTVALCEAAERSFRSGRFEMAQSP